MSQLKNALTHCERAFKDTADYILTEIQDTIFKANILSTIPHESRLQLQRYRDQFVIYRQGDINLDFWNNALENITTIYINSVIFGIKEKDEEISNDKSNKHSIKKNMPSIVLAETFKDIKKLITKIEVNYSDE